MRPHPDDLRRRASHSLFLPTGTHIPWRAAGGAGMLYAAFAALLTGVLITASAGRGAPSPPSPSEGSWKADHVSYQLERGHIILHGNAFVTISVKKSDGTVDHFVLRASEVDLASSPGAGSSLANAVADGNVTIVGRTVIPSASGQPKSVRELRVTGAHAVFSGAAETVDITGGPRVELTDSRLRQPAVVTGARTIHVDLRTRDFDAVGTSDNQVTGTFELAGPAPGNSTAGTGSQ